MYEKTSVQKFQKYGNIYDINAFEKLYILHHVTKDIQTADKATSILHAYDSNIFIKVNSGLALIVVRNPETELLETYVVHGIIELNANVYFYILSITEKLNYSVIATNDYNLKLSVLPKKYEYQPIAHDFNAHEILAYHYNIKSPNYVFSGESHDFYELTFVDYGSLKTSVDDKEYILRENEIIIYGKNQFHSQSSNGEKSTSYLTIMFNMNLNEEHVFTNKIFSCNKEIHDILSSFAKEASSNLPYSKNILISSLNILLTKLLQTEFRANNDLKPISETRQNLQNQLLDNIIIYINDKIYDPLTIEEICRNFSISRSSLQSLFKDNLSETPKKYINDIKLKKAKQLIKENKYTVSEIAFMLGFNSIHYFSRLFTSHYNITPSDYAKTIYKI